MASVVAVPAARVASSRSSVLLESTVHIVSAPNPLAHALAAKLGAAGVRTEVGSELPEGASNGVFLDALVAPHADAEGVVQGTFRHLRTYGQRRRRQTGRLVFVTGSGGDFGLETNPGERALAAAVAGLAKTAAREWPEVNVAVIDVAAGGDVSQLAARIADEILHGGSELEVGLGRNDRRVVPNLVPVKSRVTPAESRALTKGGVWVVSGGARGVTAPCLLALAGRLPLAFVLLGRTAIDVEESPEIRACRTDAELKQALLEQARRSGETVTPRQLQQRAAAITGAREARATCEALRAAGSKVRYAALDIADGQAVAEELIRVRAEWGPVRGLVHAAGVLADKAIHEKTDEQFASVWRTKVAGFRALLAATRDDPLEVVCAFSSVAARMGNSGQADYAAANEALNKLCQAEQHRRGGGCAVRAINWGPWEGGMVNAALKAHFGAMGVPLIPVAAGAEIFADIVTGKMPVAVESVVGGVLQPAKK